MRIKGWKIYNFGITPNLSPNREVESSKSEIISYINFFKKIFYARWTSDFDRSSPSEFWYIIKDSFGGMDELSSNTRSKVRRAFKTTEVKKISKDELVKNVYEVYSSAFDRYSTFTKKSSRTNFLKSLENLKNSYDFFGVYFKETNELIAYSQNKTFDDCIDYTTIKFNPKFLKYYPSYSLFYTMNEYYLHEHGFKFVSDGARSIAHNTSIQDFLEDKFKFRKAYCNLNIEYSKPFWFLLIFSRSIRFLIKHIPLDVFRKLEVLQKQEDIRRTFLS